MASKMQSKSITLKLKDVDVNLITIEQTKMGKDTVPLFRYMGDKTLYMQLSSTKLIQYGLPPGEFLSNGEKNEYYDGEDKRQSLRIPLDAKCAISTNMNDPSQTNEADILADIEKLKELDHRIKTSLGTQAGVDPDEKEKYTPIYRKAAKSKKPSANKKEKFYSMKVKFNLTNEDDKKIKTEFYEIGSDKSSTLLTGDGGLIPFDKVEETLTFGSEVTPVIHLVKVWTQSNGTWGATLKLMKIRVKKSERSERNDAEFLDDDEPVNTPVKAAKPTTPSAPVKAPAPAKIESESDEESDDEVVVAKPTPVKKAIAVVESSDDEESDEEVKPVKKAPVKAVPASKSKKSSA